MQYAKTVKLWVQQTHKKQLPVRYVQTSLKQLMKTPYMALTQLSRQHVKSRTSSTTKRFAHALAKLKRIAIASVCKKGASAPFWPSDSLAKIAQAVWLNVQLARGSYDHN